MTYQLSVSCIALTRVLEVVKQRKMESLYTLFTDQAQLERLEEEDALLRKSGYA